MSNFIEERQKYVQEYGRLKARRAKLLCQRRGLPHPAGDEGVRSAEEIVKVEARMAEIREKLKEEK